MPKLVALIASELQKLFTTRVWLWLLIASVALTALFTSLAIAFHDAEANLTPPLSSPDGQTTLLAVGHGAAGPLLAVLGAIVMAGEFRHRTATTTFLHAPDRRQVVVAKLITCAVVGVGYALCCVTATVAIAVPWLAAENVEVVLSASEASACLAGITVAVALHALLGVGLAALLQDQTAAVTTLLVYLFVVEPVLARIPALHPWSTYLPGPAANALARISDGRALLEPVPGGLVLAGYALALALAGIGLASRRDIT